MAVAAETQVDPPKKKEKKVKLENLVGIATAKTGPEVEPPLRKNCKKRAKVGKIESEAAESPIDPGNISLYGGLQEPNPKKRTKSGKKGSKARRKEAAGEVASDVQLGGGRAGVDTVPARAVDWWGASQFVSSGCLGGLNDQPKQKERKSFTEDTQADLYNRTQAAKTAGKKGLGAGQGELLVFH
jgi:hypothetical protein